MIFRMHVAALSYDELLSKGKQAEEEQDIDAAIDNYKKAIKAEPSYQLAYNRLMIVYRKQKLYKDELDLINHAIKNIQAAYNNKKVRFKSTASISKLSNALMKSTGLVDKKGNRTYEPEPISTWKKRKQTVLKRLNKKNS